MSRVLLTGGGGYVGSLLTPALLERGYDVTVLDTFLYGDTLQNHQRLTKIHCDLRDSFYTKFSLASVDAVIHLACVSNDPSFELNPALGKSVNYDATVRLIDLAKDAGVERFIYASSSSVYGVKPDGVEVTEDLPLEPLTDYSRFKAQAEEYILGAQSNDFQVTILRPATLCGYAPRQRLDLIVNILVSQAVHTGTIPVFGGSQYRPNLHVLDMVRAYLYVLNAAPEKVAGEVFNVVDKNFTVEQLAQSVRRLVGGRIITEPTNDLRSYRVSGRKILNALDFYPAYSVNEAIAQLAEALRDGRVPHAMTDSRYYNIKQMQACHTS